MAISYYDPTDHHPVPAPQRPLYATGAELLQARIARGICSDPDCGLPIDGWCIGCRAKLCERHLHDHHNQHTREYLRAQAAHVRDDAGAVTRLRPHCPRCSSEQVVPGNRPNDALYACAACGWYGDTLCDCDKQQEA